MNNKEICIPTQHMTLVEYLQLLQSVGDKNKTTYNALTGDLCITVEDEQEALMLKLKLQGARR